MRRASSHTMSCDSDNVGLMGKALFPCKGVGPGFSFSWSGLWPSPPTPCSWRVGGFIFTCFLVFRGFGAFPEGHFTRYFTCFPISLGPWARHFSRYLLCFGHLSFWAGRGSAVICGTRRAFFARARSNELPYPFQRACVARVLERALGSRILPGFGLWWPLGRRATLHGEACIRVPGG